MRWQPGNWIQLAILSLLLVARTSYSEEITRQTLVHDGRRLELQISTEFEPSMQQRLQDWVGFISQALLQVYGHWPRQHWQITVTPMSASGSDPIPWAQVHRGGVDRVEFFTAAKATSDEMKRAWTGYHELAHLLIPYQGWGDPWFSEGLASYYENILQALAGILTEQQMWQKLYEGFRRGLADTRFDGQTLEAVSNTMRQEGGFMRVYWSGAWYFLAIDARLRQQSGGRRNLDLALEQLNRCCADLRMSVPDMVSKLDELNQVLLFQPMYEELRAAMQVPPFESIFAGLGITIAHGEVQLQREGPGARLRRQIINRKTL